MDQQIQALVDKLASASGADLAELMNKIVTMRAVSHQMAARACAVLSSAAGRHQARPPQWGRLDDQAGDRDNTK
jgi:hypothetical protein